MLTPFRRRAGSTGLPRALWLSLCLGLLPPLLSGAEAGRVDFVLPAATAEVALETFAEQAAAQVVYLLDDVRGVVTHPVAGNFAPGEALERMLAGTALKGERDGSTGAFVIKVRRDPRTTVEASQSDRSQHPPSMFLRNPFARLATWLTLVVAADSPATAQTASGPATGDVVQLSPFEVNTARDSGYVASSTLAGTRFNTQLKDTPAALSIFTPDFLDDIGVTNVKDAYEYALNVGTSTTDVTGNNQQNNDISFKVRGLNNASLGRNYFVWGNNSDTYNTERLTFARGPNSVIFGIGGAGGILNTDTKRALFTPRRELQARVASHEEYRTTLDFSQPLHRTFAVRANLLWQDRNGWRDHEFERRRAVALAATWRPLPHTQVRIDAERMRVDQNKPLNWGVFDGVTPWIAAGRPIAQVNNQAVPGTAAATSAQQNYFIANSGELLRLNGTRISDTPAFPPAIASITNTWLIRDFSLVPRTVWAMGPGNNAYSDFDTLGVFVEHEVFKDFSVEAAANVQHRSALWARAYNWSHLILRADASALRPDGSRNPYVGQYFIESSINGTNTINVWNTDYRVTASYQRDLGRWFGRHQVAALVARRENENYNHRMQLFNVGTPNQPANAVAAANQIIYRTYVSFTGPNPLNLPNHIIDPLTTPVNAGGVRAGPLRVSANNDLTRIDSQLVTMQSAWLGGRLVTTFGFRRDEQEDYGSTPVLSPTRVVLGATRIATPNESNGRTRTFGAVAHLTPWLSLYYNNANNFTPQGGVAWGVDFQRKNIPRGNRRGEGQDMGAKFSLLGGRIVGTLGYYETNEVNSEKSTLTRFNETAASILTALRIPYVEVGGDDVTDFESRGTELDLTANLTPNWRLHLNGQRSMSMESNIAPWKTRWLEENLPFFRANAAVPVPSNVRGNNVGELTDFLVATQDEAKSVAGLGQFSHVRYTVNAFTNYTFAEGWLRGFSVGGGVKWRGPQVAGVTNGALVWRGQYALFDLSLGYRTKLLGLREPVQFRLHLANLFDNDTLIPTLSDGVIDYRWQFVAPRSASLTTTVKF